MYLFKQLLKENLRGLLRKRYAIIIVMIFVICLMYIQYGISVYKTALKSNQDFKKIEIKNVSMAHSYRAYGTLGFRITFSIHPLGIFFINSGINRDFNSKIDSGLTLNIANTLQGKNPLLSIILKKILITDYAGFLMLIGSLLSLFFGMELFRDREYWKSIASLIPHKRLFWTTVLVRATILTVLFFILTSFSILLIGGNGINVSYSIEFLGYILIAIAVLLFFFAAGLFIGNLKKYSYFKAITFWLIIIMGSTALIGVITSNKLEGITPVYKYELSKMQIGADFEKNAQEKAGKFPTGVKITPIILTLVKGYYNDEFQRICKIEEALYSEMAQNTTLYHLLSMLIPTTALSSTIEEVSASGMLNLLDFYRYSIEIKKKFMAFFIDNTYIKGNTGLCKVESFIKGSENVYQGKSHLPYYFPLGLLLTLIYTVTLSFLSCHKFKKRLYHVPKEEINKLKPATANLEKSTTNFYTVGSPLFKDVIYSLLSGQSNEVDWPSDKWKLTIDNHDIREIKDKYSFIYIGNQSDLPEEMIVADYLKTMATALNRPPHAIDALQLKYLEPQDLNKTIGELEDFQVGELLITPLLLRDFDLCLLFDTARNMPPDIFFKLADRMDELSLKGMVIYLNTYSGLPMPTEFSPKKIMFKDNNWQEHLHLFREIHQFNGDKKRPN
ncbi:MAG: hypothetical protein ACM3SY_21805 [Candidatus Omnitrophota bacterium]